MICDPVRRRFRRRIHRVFPSLGFVLPKTDQKRMIYVIFKKARGVGYQVYVRCIWCRGELIVANVIRFSSP